MKTVLLPVKTFSNAKQRLAPAIDPGTRAGLARAMCTDVMNALAQTHVAERVIVFTAADEVIELARPYRNGLWRGQFQATPFESRGGWTSGRCDEPSRYSIRHRYA